MIQRRFLHDVEITEYKNKAVPLAALGFHTLVTLPTYVEFHMRYLGWATLRAVLTIFKVDNCH